MYQLVCFVAVAADSSSKGPGLRRGAVGRTSSSSDDAASSSSSSSSSDNLVLNICQEKNLSATNSSSAGSTPSTAAVTGAGETASGGGSVAAATAVVETKVPATKIKIQTGGKDGSSTTATVVSSGVAPVAKKEEKMEVDDDDDEGEELKLKVSYTANISSTAVKKNEPFTPTLADFAVVTAAETAPVVTKRGRWVVLLLVRVKDGIQKGVGEGY